MNYRQVLKQRDFLFLTIGTSVSALGDQIGWIALIWFVMILTKSPMKMGLAGACYELPSIVVGLFVGALINRISRKKLMVLDNVVRGTLFLAIPVLYSVQLLPFWLLCGLLLCAGVFNPFTLVGAMAYVPDLVPDELLAQANALDETLWQGASLLGPLVGGAIITTAGASLAVLMDGLSFFMCALLLIQIRKPRLLAERQEQTEDMNAGAMAVSDGTASPKETVPGGVVEGKILATTWTQLTDGVRALLNMPVVLAITLIAFILNVAYAQLDVGLPLFVHQEIHQTGAVLGFLWTAYAVGAIVGTLLIGLMSTDGHRRLWMSVMIGGMGAGLIPMLWVRHAPVAIVLMGLSGFCFGPYGPLARTVVQKLVPVIQRDGVFGVRVSILTAGIPVGTVVGGFMLQVLTPSLWISLTGLSVVLVAAGVFAYKGFSSF